MRDVIYLKACYGAGMAVAAITCQLDLDRIAISHGEHGYEVDCVWKPQASTTEREFLIMALAGHVGSKTGRGKRVHRPSGADYMFRAHDDLQDLTRLIEVMYERASHRVQGAVVPNHKLFVSTKFEEAWSDVISILTQPELIEATRVIAQRLSEQGKMSGEEVQEVVANAWATSRPLTP